MRLSWFLERHDIFTRAQCGFRKHRSAVDHILALDTEVRSGFIKKKHIGAVFFDIEAAYDTVPRDLILRKLHNYGICGRMGLFIENFLLNRRFRVRVGSSHSSSFEPEKGVPQGGVLSVALFAVLINDISDELPAAVGRSLFVDDLAIWYTASGASHVSRQLQLAVTRLEQWSTNNGLRFSVAKTTSVHFCRRRCADPDLGIRLYGQTVKTELAARFLGVIFDRRLTYKEHFKRLREKCFKALDVLKCVSRTSYGSDRSTLLLLYRAIVRSKLDYACFVYDGACESSKTMLDTVHHASLRVVTGAFRTSPVPSLLAEVNEPPLSVRRQMLGMRYALKLRQFPAHPTYPCVFSRHLLSLFDGSTQRHIPFGVRTQNLIARSGLSLRNVMRVETLASPPWQNIRPQIDLTLANMKKDETSPIEFRLRAFEHMASYEGRSFIYTDGSKTAEGVGCAFVAGRDSRSFSLPANASVFTSEIIAISKALCFIEVCAEKSYLILTDSLSSLLALRGFYPMHPLIQETLTRLTSLDQAGKNVQFCWIPSHVGIQGNERADAAARQAASAPCVRRLPLPARDFYPACRTFMQSQWQLAWEAQRQNKLREIKPTLEAWSSSARGVRLEEVILCRLRIGHTYATHGHLLRGEDRPSCPQCDEPITTEHILLACTEYDEERRRHLGHLSRTVTLRDLLCDTSRWIQDGSIFSFIRDIGFSVLYSPR